jgi:hypothetical protein
MIPYFFYYSFIYLFAAAAPQEDWASDLTASAAVSGAGRLKMPATRMQQKKTYRDHPYQFP